MPGTDPTEYAIRLGLWLAARRRHPNPGGTTLVAAEPLDRTSSAYTIAESDVEAMLEELKALRAQRTSLDGQVFIGGWYAHAEACQAPGWDAREAAWRKYREEMAATLAKAAPQQPAPDTADMRGCDHAPGWQCAGCVGEGEFRFEPLVREQQPAPDTACACGCGRPDDDTDMCHCPTPCPCEPDCGFCLVPNPMRKPARDTADGGAVSDRAELITWCRILGTGPACAKPCDDCRRTSAINAKLPDDFRVTMAAVRAEREGEAEHG